MKKRNWLILLLLTSITFTPPAGAETLGDGSLQLNPNIITNSNIRVGKGDDFPEMPNLFLISRKSKNSVFNLPNQTSKVHFGLPVKIRMINYDSKTRQLFRNYHPKVTNVTSNHLQPRSSSLFGHIAAGVLFLFSAGLAYLIGRSIAKRHLERHKEADYGV